MTFSAVSANNFDDRSLEINDKITLAIHDDALAPPMDAIFLKYVACK